VGGRGRGVVAVDAAGAGRLVCGIPKVLGSAGERLSADGGALFGKGQFAGIAEERVDGTRAVNSLEEAYRPSQKRAGDGVLHGRVAAAEGPVVRDQVGGESVTFPVLAGRSPDGRPRGCRSR
jgi:hypothetical protein